MERQDSIGTVAELEYENQKLRNELKALQNEHFFHPEGESFLDRFTIQENLTQSQALDALRESEEKFRTLADNISQFAWMADAEGWIFWYNKRWFEYTGTTLEVMQGWGWEKVHHPDHLERVKEHFKHSLATGEPWEDIFPLRRYDGEYGWFLSRALPIKDEQGNIVRWFGTNTDITQHRQTEIEMVGLASQLRTILENISDGVVVYNKDGKLLEINKTALTLAGWTEGVAGTHFLVDVNTFILYDTYNQLVDTSHRPIQRAIRGEKYCSLEYRVVNRKNNEEFYLDYSAAPVFDDHQVLVFTVITIHDITQRKKSEIERALVRDELEKSHELMESVMRIAAHDLRGPIGTIGLSMEVMEHLTDEKKKNEYH